MTAREALLRGRRSLESAGITDAALEAEVLLRDALNVARAGLFTSLEQPLMPSAEARFTAMLARRLEREPLAYITGRREFFGLELTINPDVLVPRQETEHLVEEVLRHLTGRRAPVVADIGTGCGAIALAVAHAAPNAQVIATDLSRSALALARRNAVRLGLDRRIRFRHGDLLEPLREKVDIIAANLPYIPTAAMKDLQPEVRDFEPIGALDGGPDGLVLIRRLLEQVPGRLTENGAVVLEVGAGQAGPVCELAGKGSLRPAAVLRDLAGIERVVTLLAE